MTNKFSLAAVALIATMSVASAADMGRPVYKAPPMAVAAYNWSGLYVGVHVGYGAVSANFNRTANPSDDGDTAFVGGQIGYNWQAAGSPWVFGIEADGASTGDDSNPGPTAVNAAVTTIKSLGTVRGRVGYAVDRVLWYATGGFAWANNDVTLSGPIVGGSISSSSLHTGWTIGAGVEWAFYDAWSVKAEYLYMNLGREDYFAGVFGPPGLGIDYEIHTIKAGLNYTFGAGKGPVVAKY